MISVVIVSFNEAEKLEECLKSLDNFPDEIILIDLESEDNTLNIAKRFNAKIFSHEKVNYVEKVRNFAISKASGDWVLILDPDERLTQELSEILKKIAIRNEYAAVNIPRKNVFFNKWISHTNWWPDRHIRFFKKNSATWNKEIHSYPKVMGKILNLEAKEDLAIIHHGYVSLKEFIDRQNRYSSVEALNLFEHGEKFTLKKMFWSPLREFLARYIKHQGFLDGFVGFSLTYLMMIYQISVWIKVWELQQKAKRQ